MPYVTTLERYGMEIGSREAFREAISLALGARFGNAGKRLMSKVREIGSSDELYALLKFIHATDHLGKIRARLPAAQPVSKEA